MNRKYINLHFIIGLLILILIVVFAFVQAFKGNWLLSGFLAAIFLFLTIGTPILEKIKKKLENKKNKYKR